MNEGWTTLDFYPKALYQQGVYSINCVGENERIRTNGEPHYQSLQNYEVVTTSASTK